MEIHDHGELRTAVIVKIEQDRLTLQAEGGRKLTEKRDQVVALLGGSAFTEGSDPDAVLQAHRAQLQEARADVDLASLWELLVDQGRGYSLSTLASLVFSPVTPARRSALLRALTDDSVYFRQHRKEFIARSRSEVRAALDSKARAREEARLRSEFLAWLKQLRQQEQPPPPKDASPWLDLLTEYVVSQENAERSHEARELLKEAGYPPSQANPETAFSILVQAGRLHPDENLLLHRYAWRRDFNHALREEAREAARRLADLNDREDLSGKILYTIDAPETREIDDAIGLIKRYPGGGWRIGVHIADPDHFVQAGEPLDIEAGLRGTTLYLPDAHFTLFPELLAEGPMSLTEGEDRPALSFLFDVAKDGEIGGLTLTLSRVRVARRFSYEEADEAIYTGGADGDHLATLLEAAEAIRQRRLETGALVFSTPEVSPYVKESSITLKRADTSSPARDLVSELMIATNLVAAQFFERAGQPAIYRAQSWQKPLFIPPVIPQGDDPATLFQLTSQLGKTEISPHPRRHVGLGLSSYVHVTSPIRRYIDLLLHRQLKAIIRKQPAAYDAHRLWSLAQVAERRANEAKLIEAWSREYWMLRYFAQNPGLKATAVVLRELEAGKYQVELVEYSFRTVLRGRNLQPGDRVPVEIQGARPREGVLNLSVLPKAGKEGR